MPKLTKEALAALLEMLFSQFGTWHDDGSMVIYDEEHLKNFSAEIAERLINLL